MMNEIWILIISGLIIFLSSTIRGTTGFGLALTSVPLLSLLLPMKDAVVFVALVNLLFSVVHLVSEKGKIPLKDIILISLFSIAGVVVGVQFLKLVEGDVLKIICGSIIVIYAILILTGLEIRIGKKEVAYSLTGLVGGILTGSIGIGGPFAAMILSSARLNESRFRYSMSIYFLVSYLSSVSAFTASGMITGRILLLLAVGIPFMIGGYMLGGKIAGHISQKLFNRIILLLIFVMGLIIIIESVPALW